MVDCLVQTRVSHPPNTDLKWTLVWKLPLFTSFHPNKQHKRILSRIKSLVARFKESFQVLDDLTKHKSEPKNFEEVKPWTCPLMTHDVSRAAAGGFPFKEQIFPNNFPIQERRTCIRLLIEQVNHQSSLLLWRSFSVRLIETTHKHRWESDILSTHPLLSFQSVLRHFGELIYWTDSLKRTFETLPHKWIQQT